MEDKLLFILVYLKHNLHQEIQGCLFGMSQTNVSKWTHLLHRILNQALAQQSYLPARTAEEFAVYLQDRAKTDVSERTSGGRSDPGETRSEITVISPTSPEDDRDTTISHGSAQEAGIVAEPAPDSRVVQETVTEATAARIFFHDGVERPINRPCDPFDQEDYYSGKKKHHTQKAQVIADRKSAQIVATAFCHGSKHDFQLFKDDACEFSEHLCILTDAGDRYAHRGCRDVLL